MTSSMSNILTYMRRKTPSFKTTCYNNNNESNEDSFNNENNSSVCLRHPPPSSSSSSNKQIDSTTPTANGNISFSSTTNDPSQRVTICVTSSPVTESQSWTKRLSSLSTNSGKKSHYSTDSFPRTSLRAYQRRSTKVNFEVTQPAGQVFRTDRLPSQVTELLVFLAREAIGVPDIFRRSGSAHDIKKILRQLRDGTKVSWTEYSFYTLANVAKRFLLCIEGGILGGQTEESLINALQLPSKQETLDTMHKILMNLSLPVQSLLVLLFGTWFRMINHTDVNAMCLEAVAKSVAGSVFLNSCSDIEKVEYASHAMQFIIHNFTSSSLFGPQLLHYFAQQTKTSICGIEKFQYNLQYPKDIPWQQCARHFVKLLKSESDRLGFDLLRDIVSEDKFHEDKSQSTTILERYLHTTTQVDSVGIGGVVGGGEIITDTIFENDEELSKQVATTETERQILSMIEETTYRRNIFNSSSSLSTSDKYSRIRELQMERLKLRSDWFMQCKQQQNVKNYDKNEINETIDGADGNEGKINKNDVQEKRIYFVVKRIYGPL